LQTICKNRVEILHRILSVTQCAGVFVVIAVFISSLYLALGTLLAAKYLHSQVLSHVLKNPLSFFDTTPTGRILNRFSKDIDTLDNTIPHNIRAWLNCLFLVMMSFCKIPVTSILEEKQFDIKEIKFVSLS
jgi:ABC-type multidrug transport system fused ATPase/permease subunit